MRIERIQRRQKERWRTIRYFSLRRSWMIRRWWVAAEIPTLPHITVYLRLLTDSLHTDHPSRAESCIERSHQLCEAVRFAPCLRGKRYWRGLPSNCCIACCSPFTTRRTNSLPIQSLRRTWSRGYVMMINPRRVELLMATTRMNITWKALRAGWAVLQLQIQMTESRLKALFSSEKRNLKVCSRLISNLCNDAWADNALHSNPQTIRWDIYYLYVQRPTRTPSRLECPHRYLRKVPRRPITAWQDLGDDNQSIR